MFENRSLEILIVALVVLLLFGSRRLPGAARSLGRSLRILKAETHALRTDHAPQAAQNPAPDTVPGLFDPAPLAAEPRAAEAQPTTSEQTATPVSEGR
jgi:sec-independent protein translocase protein TatA